MFSRATLNAFTVGHFAKDCPTGGSRACRNCGEEGHMSKECDKPKNPENAICRNCDESKPASSQTLLQRLIVDIAGHFSRDCPKPRDYSRVKCQNCGESKCHPLHTISDLTNVQWDIPSRDARSPLLRRMEMAISERMVMAASTQARMLATLVETHLAGQPILDGRHCLSASIGETFVQWSERCGVNWP